MTQLIVYRNENPSTKKAVPFLLDVQSELLSVLQTRVVVPLYVQHRGAPKPISRLTPVVEIVGKKCVLMTPELAGVPVRLLKDRVGTLANRRDEIIAALDLLFTGH